MGKKSLHYNWNQNQLFKKLRRDRNKLESQNLHFKEKQKNIMDFVRGDD